MDVEQALAGIDALIERRSRERDRDNTLEEMWKASERKHLEKRRSENRLAWLDFHLGQAARLRHTMGLLIAKHEAAAKLLQEEGGGDVGPS